MTASEVRVPSEAVAGDDIAEPSIALLRGLKLLPAEGELSKARGLSSAFSGPPESVALIEAGATAASKWWAAGLSGLVVAAWALIRGWWSSNPDNQHVALWVGAVVTAAAILGIAYLLGSDLRGRAAVATETVRARASVAEAFVRAAEQAHSRAAATQVAAARADGFLMGFLPGIVVEHTGKPGSDEGGWRVLAVLTDGDQRTRYLLGKGSLHEWVDAERVRLPLAP
ncbi:hypothetical protein [Phytohabitans houttuyneae]|jgi:hypothetical protein|uniref:Uncharacterized protein n=1 Tax=Phytohabitans houttuyneae TaxID=1076126 RepID=A0A6V8JY35_9ACTN|nr:hypothetical protein [Phytohabitans houttuyneae]GFJ76164.1 hypothetical protein Phou_003440 [Phytohabitans houttuyneae]